MKENTLSRIKNNLILQNKIVVSKQNEEKHWLDKKKKI